MSNVAAGETPADRERQRHQNEQDGEDAAATDDAKRRRRVPPEIDLRPGHEHESQHGVSPAIKSAPVATVFACLAASAPIRFATDCHRLQPEGSIKAPSSVACAGYVTAAERSLAPRGE